MGLLDLFRSPRRSSASVAKERLQIIVAHERGRASAPHYLPLLQQDLLQAVRKYVAIDDDQVTVTVDRRDDREVLELNIALPDVPESVVNPVAAADGEAPSRNTGAPRGGKRRRPRRR